MLNKKIRKLVKNPKLFFSDMTLKRSKQISILKPKKIAGENKFTVVSAVYNVGRYLDKYFDGFVNQRLDFENNIQLILVDDGSHDDSAAVIERWQRKYPNNIMYLKKENGGQASARNYGLQFVKTKWVTFIDPDDFVDINYFLSAENFINKNKNSDIGMLSCSFVFYFDDVEQFKDTHPLKYRFDKGDRLVDIASLKKDVQLSASTAIFKNEIISSNNLKFSEDIKPSFEDAHFVGTYMMHLSSEKVAFLKSATYFYRKRSDGSSTLDKAWEKLGLYNVVLERGCLDLLKKYTENKGSVPESIQVTVLYHLIWYFRRLVDNSHKLSFLSEKEKKDFMGFVDEIFEYITPKVIMEFSLAGCWFFHKVGFLGAFKNLKPANQIIYIESYDRVKGLAQLRYFTHGSPDVSIQSGSTFILPYYEKDIVHDFVDRIFVREKRLWVKVEQKNKLVVKLDNKIAVITCAGKQHKDGILGKDIISYSESLVPDYVMENEHSDAWVFMDRDFQADDNAEHLYRYVMQEHPEKNIYFVLNRDSHDWDRLTSEGFRMLEFGSASHHEVLKSCSKVISSNADQCVVNLLGPKMLSGRHFVFLQHGVIKDDLSGWLNQKENIDCFVTSTPDEYESIAGNLSKYKYSSKEVVLTGLPRHDYLARNNNRTEKLLLIMPTWRADIVGKSAAEGHSRQINDEFIETNFARHWLSLLRSERLAKILEQYGYRAVIYPHPNLIPYAQLFKVGSNIEICTPEEDKIQDVFCRSAMLLTDYSSVAFDIAVQMKQTVYYQFDEQAVLHSGSHTYAPGYFDYRRDGFGPVCTDEESVLDALETALCNGCIPDNVVAERIAGTLPFRDGRCCERTFNAIEALDNPELPEIAAERMIEQAERMTREGHWAVAESWWKSLAQREDVWHQPEWYRDLLENNCLNVLEEKYDTEGVIPENMQATVLYHMYWYIRQLMDNAYRLSWMSSTEQADFLSLTDKIFSYIDDKTILKFSREGSWFLHKFGMLNAFKGHLPDIQFVYIDGYDRVKGLVQLRYFIRGDEAESFRVGGNYTLPVYEKIIRHDILGRDFVREKRVWLAISAPDKLVVNISGLPTILSFAGKQHKDGILGKDIISYSESLVPDYVMENEHSDAWVFMDRDFQADDNAEHLYRYVMQEHPEKNIYFVLNRDSHDWDRLTSEGFRMLEFGSASHHEVLKSCSKVISSNADQCVVNLLGPKMLSGRHFVFLQHGVIKDDLSGWLNQKENIDCFVTSTPDEYESIAGNLSKYKYSSKEVVLTGLPRHDYLARNNNRTEKLLLIMPTWRADIVGKSAAEGHSRQINDEFIETNFARHWLSLLRSERLAKILEQYGYRAVIYPHPNLIPYAQLFKVGSNIEICTPEEDKIQDVFCRSAMLLTDYSSVAFDIAVQMKQTVYYQFDEQAVLHSGSHTYAPGYFDYRRDGFGPVCTDEESVLDALETALCNGCIPDNVVAERIAGTLPFRDGRCCERTFNAIEALDNPELPEIAAERMIEQAERMTREGHWAVAESWWKSLAQREDVWHQPEWYRDLLENNCLNVLEEKYDTEGVIPENMQATVLYHMYWYIRQLMDNAYRLSWMSSTEQADFLSLTDKIFSYIDDKTILKFSREGSWFLHKFGMLNAFKGHLPDIQFVYIDGYDRVKGLVQLRYFIRGDEAESFRVGGNYTLPVYEKIIRHDILGRDFVREKRVWLAISAPDKLVVNISGLPTILSYGGKQYKDGTTGQSIITYFDSLNSKYLVQSEYVDAWVFMDRDFQADDNAEYLYRYVMQKHPEKNIYFALNRDSHDWDRLKSEGFRLLPFGSQRHVTVLRNCDKVIFSQMKSYYDRTLSVDVLVGKHLIYLQSGVGYSDLLMSSEINDKLDCIVTSTTDEYRSIISNDGKYPYSEKEVILTGTPKIDVLMHNSINPEKCVLIIPNRSGIDNESSLHQWMLLIKSNEFQSLLELHGYKAILYINDEYVDELEDISKNDCVSIVNYDGMRNENILYRSCALLTDYSPVTFDMAVLNKPTIYYHFNQENITLPGNYLKESYYFNYNRDGFGPVCTSFDAVINKLNSLLKNKCHLDINISKRIDSIFYHRDGKCCELITNAIESLNSSQYPEVSYEKIIKHIVQITNVDTWPIVTEWWKQILRDEKCWDTLEVYTELLESSCLDLLRSVAEKIGYVSENIQTTTLQSLFFYFKRFIDNANDIGILDDDKTKKCWSVIKEIFNYIDEKTIMKFSYPGYWFLHKVGLLGSFKDLHPESQIIYLEGIDRVKELVQIRYFTCADEPLLVDVNGQYSYPIYIKNTYHSFLGNQFVIEKRSWVKLSKTDTISIGSSAMSTFISIGGRQYRGTVSGKVIFEYFDSLLPKYKVENDYSDAWVFMDYNTRAGDNAEHLYRYVMKNHPERNIFFALNNSSSDWARLEQDGFNLLAFGSDKHKDVLKTCSKLISSQTDRYVTNLLGPKMLLGRHFVWLQHSHSIKLNNFYNLLNSKDNIDCLITSSDEEYNSILSEKSLCRYSSKEVALTGMPIFDVLSNKSNHGENLIVVALNLMDINIIDNELSEFEVVNKWISVFKSEHFSQLIDKNRYKLAIYIQSERQWNYEKNLLPYNIELFSSENRSISDVLLRAKILLTDDFGFSSLMAIQNKPTIYFGDCNRQYQGSILGAICDDPNEMIKNVSSFIENNSCFVVNDHRVISNTIDVTDGQCCLRVYNAIEKLDSNECSDSTTIQDKISIALLFSEKKQWVSASKIWDDIVREDNNLDYKIKLIESLQLGLNIVEMANVIESLDGVELSVCDFEQTLILSYAYFLLGEHHKVFGLLNKYEHSTVVCMPSYYYMSRDIVDGNPAVIMDEQECNLFTYIRSLLANNEYDIAIQYLRNPNADVDVALRNSLMLEVLYMAKRYDCLLDEFSGYKCYDLKSHYAEIYFSTLLNNGLYDVILSYEERISDLCNNKSNELCCDIVNLAMAESHFQMKKWHSAIHYFNLIETSSYNFSYKLAYSYRMLGDLESALNKLDEDIKISGDSKIRKESWMLLIEVAQIMNNWELVAMGWNRVIRFFSDDLPENAWSNLKKAQLMSSLNDLNDTQKTLFLMTMSK